MGFVNAMKYVCVPYMRITAKFVVKEDFELNAFQLLIIDSLNEDATIDQMTVATQLTRNVIEAELIQLEAQGLVARDNDTYVLTELSKRILFVSQKVEEMNAEKNQMCINLITGDIDSYDENKFSQPYDGDIVLKHRNLNLDGISIEDNMEFFSEKMESLKECDGQQKEIVLSSMYVELYQYRGEDSQGIFYERLMTKYIPCLAGDLMLDESDRDKDLTVEGCVQRVSFSFSFNGQEQYQDILPDLEKINKIHPNMLSGEAHNVLDLYTLCNRYEKMGIGLIYDGIADKIIADKGSVLQSKNLKPQMILDDVYVKNDEFDRRFIEWVKEIACVDDSINITIDKIKTENYTMKICLESLWEEK